MSQPNGSERWGELAAQFESAWRSAQRDECAPPDLDSYLPAGPDRIDALVELIYYDLEYRMLRGEAASLNDYVRRFPELADSPEMPALAAHEADCRRRRSTSGAQQLIDVGAHIGPYQIVGRLGEGAMGVVYRARQQAPIRRDVALKLIKSGWDSAQVLARFEQERQALAVMDHPAIARVLDGGVTETGRAYFVMEYVQGLPITDFCDQHRMSVRDRLVLFMQVCQAVQHAHQKGIIHRDLKPGNILVTEVDGRPVPKVIDFGLAKALERGLTEESFVTELGAIIGTPEYMAPEQAAPDARDIDTRADVYSLGVLLFELLTGTTPIVRKELQRVGFLELLRLIREADPPAPSARLSGIASLNETAARRNTNAQSLNRTIRGELDWIAQRALENDRSRRYETANEFAADIERYLGNEPVLAGPPSRSYRFAKFAQRHQVAILTAAVFSVVLIVVSVSTAWGWYEANAARDMANQKSEIAEYLQRRAVDAEKEASQKKIEAERAWAAERAARSDAVERAKEADEAKLKALDSKAKADANAETATERKKEAEGLAAKLADSNDKLQGLNNNLVEANTSLSQARSRAENQLIRSYVEKAEQLLASGNDIESICWLTAALEIAKADPKRRLPHIMRLDAVLKQCPTVIKSISYQGPMLGLASHPKGTCFSVIDSNGHIHLHRSSGERLGPIIAEGHSVRRCEFSPGGTRLLTAGADNSVRVWSLDNGRELHRYDHSEFPFLTVFGADGRHVVSAAGGEVKFCHYHQKTPAVVATHSSMVTALAASGDEDAPYVAVGHDDGTIRVFDMNGEFKRQLKHGTTVWQLAFSPDGRRLFSGGRDGKVNAWSLGQSQTNSLPVCEHKDGVLCLSVAPGPGPGDYFLASSGYDRVVRVHAAHAPTQELQPVAVSPEQSAVPSVVMFTPGGSGRLLFVSSDNCVRDWNWRRPLAKIAVLPHPCTIVQSAALPESIATAGIDGQVRIWQLNVNRYAFEFAPNCGDLNWVALRAADDCVAMVGDRKSMWLWWPQTGANQPAMEGCNAGRQVLFPSHKYRHWPHEEMPFIALFGELEFHPPTPSTNANAPPAPTPGPIPPTATVEGAVQNRERAGGIAFIRARDGFNFTGEKGSYHRAEFSLSGEKVLTVEEDRSVRLWSSDGRLLHHFDLPRSSGVRQSNSNGTSIGLTQLATIGGFLSLFQDVASDSPKVQAPAPSAVLQSPPTHSVLTPSSQLTQGSIASKRRSLHSWIQPTTHRCDSYGIATFNPRDDQILTFSPDASVAYLWDGRTYERVSSIKSWKDSRWVFGAFSPDGKQLLLTDTTYRAQVWALERVPVPLAEVRHNHVVNRVAWHPSGRRFATAGADGLVMQWDAVSGKPLGWPMKHSAPVYHVEFNDGGDSLLSFSRIEARIWDAATGESLVPPLRHSDEITWATLHPLKKAAVTVGRDGKAIYWEFATVEQLKLLFHPGSTEGLLREAHFKCPWEINAEGIKTPVMPRN